MCTHILIESVFQRCNTEKVLYSSAEKHLHCVGLLSHRLASFCLRSLCFTSDVSCMRSRVGFFICFPYRQDDLHRSAPEQTADPCELCADVKGVEARPGGVRPLSIRGLAGVGRTEGEITCITIESFTGNRNLIPMPQQWNHLYDGTEACLFEIN